jgi:hypothetical protein
VATIERIGAMELTVRAAEPAPQSAVTAAAGGAA